MTAAVHETVDDCLNDALTQSAWDQAAIVSDEVRAPPAGNRLPGRDVPKGPSIQSDHRSLAKTSASSSSPSASVGSAQAHRFTDLVLRNQS